MDAKHSKRAKEFPIYRRFLAPPPCKNIQPRLLRLARFANKKKNDPGILSVIYLRREAARLTKARGRNMGIFDSGMKVNTPIRKDGTSDGLGEIVGHGWKTASIYDTECFYHVALLELKPTQAGRIIRIYTESQLSKAE